MEYCYYKVSVNSFLNKSDNSKIEKIYSFFSKIDYNLLLLFDMEIYYYNSSHRTNKINSFIAENSFNDIFEYSYIKLNTYFTDYKIIFSKNKAGIYVELVYIDKNTLKETKIVNKNMRELSKILTNKLLKETISKELILDIIEKNYPKMVLSDVENILNNLNFNINYICTLEDDRISLSYYKNKKILKLNIVLLSSNKKLFYEFLKYDNNYYRCFPNIKNALDWFRS